MTYRSTSLGILLLVLIATPGKQGNKEQFYAECITLSYCGTIQPGTKVFLFVVLNLTYRFEVGCTQLHTVVSISLQFQSGSKNHVRFRLYLDRLTLSLSDSSTLVQLCAKLNTRWITQLSCDSKFLTNIQQY